MTTQKIILIIDDDAFAQKFYGGGLEEAGFKVAYASDGKVGLEAAKAGKPDAIILDLLMPVMGGLAVLAALKRDATLRAIPVIVLSGAGSEEDLKRCQELGAELCLSKLATLPAKLAEYCAARFIRRVPATFEAPTTKVGELSNIIFVQAARQIEAVVAQMTHRTITAGDLKATTVSTEVLKKYLGELTEQTGMVASYSVLKPPVGAAMLMVSKEATVALASFLEDPERAPSTQSPAAVLTELYNIMANTFLNVITAGLKADTMLLYQSPLLSTPDIAVRLMRKDGFVLDPDGINFIFRQTYEAAQTNVTCEFILLFSNAGLALLEKWNGGGLVEFFKKYMKASDRIFLQSWQFQIKQS